MTTILTKTNNKKSTAKVIETPNYEGLVSAVLDLGKNELSLVESYRKLGQESQELKDRYQVTDNQVVAVLEGRGISFSRAKISRARKIFNSCLEGDEAVATINGRGMEYKDPSKSGNKAGKTKTTNSNDSESNDESTDENNKIDELDTIAKNLVNKYTEEEIALIFQKVSKLMVIKTQNK